MKKKGKFAFCLFKYFPYGGLQRDFLRISEVCASRGHRVDVFTMSWEGAVPDHLNVSIIPSWGFSNHRLCWRFAKRLNTGLRQLDYDAVVGFNKMPGLDIYYAADGCFAARAQERSFLYRLSGRYRYYLHMERAVFGKDSKTAVLVISEPERTLFRRYYGTQEHRLYSLPPGISRDRKLPEDPEKLRRELRKEMGIPMKQKLVLMVGSGFRTKGLDRAIRALSSLPPVLLEETTLLVLGRDNPGRFKRLAGKLGVEERIIFPGAREDVERFLCAADLLLHPSYRENTGTVLIEAMASGLPVLATDVCGYAGYVREAGAGRLVTSPFEQEKLNALLAHMLDSGEKDQWGKKGLQYVSEKDVFSMPEKAADIIEEVARCW